jgi:hypothetical protein
MASKPSELSRINAAELIEQQRQYIAAPVYGNMLGREIRKLINDYVLIAATMAVAVDALIVKHTERGPQ